VIVDVFVLSVADNRDADADAEGVLAPDELARATRLRDPSLRAGYRVAHVLLRRQIARRLKQDPACLQFAREACPLCDGPHGRPYVDNAAVSFSLSHSGDLVVIAQTDHGAIGVDVEATISARDVATLDCALHPQEAAELARLPERVLPQAITANWCRKEAYLKALGCGLGKDPAGVLVGPGPGATRMGGHEDPWLVTSLDVPAGYACALAVSGWALPEVSFGDEPARCSTVAPRVAG